MIVGYAWRSLALGVVADVVVVETRWIISAARSRVNKNRSRNNPGRGEPDRRYDTAAEKKGEFFLTERGPRVVQ
jgi:hypothetical protein